MTDPKRSQLPIMLSYNQTPEAEPTTTSSPVALNGVMKAPASVTYSTGNSTPTTITNSTFNYCFLESQNWVGVNALESDCDSDPNTTLCAESEPASRIVSGKSHPIDL